MLNVDWLFLGAALVLLLPPVAWLHGANVRHRHLTRDWRGAWGATLSLPHHTIDLLRAAAGTWLLVRALPLSPNLADGAKHLPLLLAAGVLGLALTLQTIVCKEPDSFNAPLPFAAGIALGAVPPLVAAFALVIAIAVARGTATAAFFLVLALAIPGMGRVFHGDEGLLPLLAIAAPLPLPWLLPLLFGRDLVLAQRIRTRSAAEQAEPPPR
jgi:hypothetical protein